MTMHYRATVGLNWPPAVRREAGADVSDMPAASLPHELAAGHVEAYAPPAQVTAETGPPGLGPPPDRAPAGDPTAAGEG